MDRKPSRLDPLAGYAAMFVLATLAIAACNYQPNTARAGTVCRNGGRCATVVHSYAAPVAKVAAYPVSYYTVAPQLAQQSSETYAFRQSAEWQDYQQLLGLRRGLELAESIAQGRADARAQNQLESTPVENRPAGPAAQLPAQAELGAQQLPAQPTAADLAARGATAEQIMAAPGYAGRLDNTTGKWEPAPGYDGPTPEPPGIPSEPIDPGPPVAPGPVPTGAQPDRAPGAVDPSWLAFESRYPTIAASCSSCHGRNDPLAPAGGIDLAGAEALDGDDGGAPERRDAIVRMIWRGHMPPKKPASDEQVAAIIAELYDEAPAQ